MSGYSGFKSHSSFGIVLCGVLVGEILALTSGFTGRVIYADSSPLTTALLVQCAIVLCEVVSPWLFEFQV